MIHLKRVAAPYRLKVSCISADSIDFLDVTLFKGKQWRQSGILDSKPFVKPTRSDVYLSMLSMHPLSLHKAWPKGRCIHYEKVSSSVGDAKKAISDLCLALKKHEPDHVAIDSSSLRLQHGRTVREKRLKTGTFFVVPYHPEIRRCGINVVCSSYNKYLNMMSVCREFSYYSEMNVEISYALGGNHFQTTLAQTNETVLIRAK